MTTKMKLALALLVMVVVPGARAQTQTNVNVFAYGYFTAPDGRLALVNIVRTRDLSNVVTTRLFYTFCAQANTGATCQQGDGLIPNSTLQGTVFFDRTKPDVMRVTVDTSTVAGYHNELCPLGLDDYAECLGGGVPATGGLIAVTWTRTNEWANLYTSKATQYHFGTLVSTATMRTGGFTAVETGTVLGVNAATPAGAPGAQMTTSTDAQTLQAQFKARKTASIKGGVK